MTSFSFSLFFHKLIDFLMPQRVIKAHFYYLVCRKPDSDFVVEIPKRFCDYEFCLLNESDIQRLESIFQKDPRNKKSVRSLSREGKRCYGLKHQGEVVSFLWCDFEECHFPPCRYPLRKNEVYLFDGYTHPLYRGQGVFTLLLLKVEESLLRDGGSTFYAVPSCLNSPSLRALYKTQYHKVKQCLFVELFGCWRKNWVLKKF